MTHDLARTDSPGISPPKYWLSEHVHTFEKNGVSPESIERKAYGLARINY